MAWTNTFIIIVLTSCGYLNFAYAKPLPSLMEHAVLFSTWGESSKVNVDGANYKIQSQISQLFYKLSVVEDIRYFNFQYFGEFGYGLSNTDSDQNFTFKQSAVPVYTLGAGFSLHRPLSLGMSTGLQFEIFNRLIDFKESDESLKIYQKEKTIFSLGIDFLFRINDQKKINQQFSFLSEGSLKWSIGLVF